MADRAQAGAEGSHSKDKFVDMVSAKAEAGLPLSEFQPCYSLKVPSHIVERTPFAALEYHTYLDS